MITPACFLHAVAPVVCRSAGVLLVCVCVVGCANANRSLGSNCKPQQSIQSGPRFFPAPLADDWTRWIVGDWEGAAKSDSGLGTAFVHIETGLSGQFLIIRSEAKIIELESDYLKKHMNASDEEIERFKRSGYQALELYTVDPQTGDVIGFLFDNLRCIATGKGRREGFRETIEWEWRSGHKSTRITERVGGNKLVGIERTLNADGSIMEDRGELTRRE